MTLRNLLSSRTKLRLLELRERITRIQIRDFVDQKKISMSFSHAPQNTIKNDKKFAYKIIVTYIDQTCFKLRFLELHINLIEL